MDAGNLLKPMLARGELHCIGATTLDEYRKHIEKDAALERRFQPVVVDEPSVEDTISILRGLRERFEVHHGVRIQDNALVARRDAFPSLHLRPVPAGQGDRPRRRGVRDDPHRDRFDAAGARRDHAPRACDSRSRRHALTKETDDASRERLDALRRSSPTCGPRRTRMTAAVGGRARGDQSARRAARGAREGAPGDRRGRARLRPEPGRRAAPRPTARSSSSSSRRRRRVRADGPRPAAAPRGGHGRGDRRGRGALDGDPGHPAARGRAREAAAPRRGAARARDRPGRGRAARRPTRSSAPARASRIRAGRSASFIFLGPTGVGKTELAQALAADRSSTPRTTWCGSTCRSTWRSTR